ncbi:Chromo domain-like protein [Akanthomyces lecanii RCEF 1005]|uniref:Chromo domain-like protein n=1 Tax=Akanthomyces lecanii RCEF 1005 TaxID=1081108 RepID=A0A169YJ59_CORDF|nr:Chromo domain-like protein [Akanthomyces lecanii RCEF 1005]
MSPTVVCLPFPTANGTQEQHTDDAPSNHQSENHIRSDILHARIKKKVMTPERAAAPARPRRSQLQAAQSTPERMPSLSESATESEGGNATTAHTPATTPSINGSALKRKRTEVPNSNSEEEPRPAPKRKGGRKRQSQGHIQSPKKAVKEVEEKEDGIKWEVERIVGDRIEADTYIHWYQVKWKGYSTKHNTWEPKKNLTTCQGLIEDFERLGSKIR